MNLKPDDIAAWGFALYPWMAIIGFIFILILWIWTGYKILR